MPKKFILVFLSSLFLLTIFPKTAQAVTTPFGVNTAVTSIFSHVDLGLSAQRWPEYFRRAAEAGVKQTRNPIFWHLIQPFGPDEFDWTAYDYYFDLLTQNHLDILGTLIDIPNWAKTNPNCSSEIYGFNTCEPKTSYWQNFVRKVVERYGCGSGGKCQIKEWEIWNEPNLDGFWENAKTATGRQKYANLLASAYNIIKVVDPNAKVVMAGLSQGDQANPGFKEYGYLDQLLYLQVDGNPMGNYFDVFNIHTYTNPTDAGIMVEDAKKVISKHGLQTKPLYVTEFNDEYWNNPTTEHAASLLTPFYEKFLSKGVAKIYLYAMDYLGIFSHDSSGIHETVAYPLFKDLTSRYISLYQPIDLKATCLGTNVKLEWDPLPNATGYKITIGNTSQTAITNSLLFSYTPGQSYNWGVQGTNQYGLSAATNSSFVCYGNEPSPTTTPTATPTLRCLPRCTQTTNDQTAITNYCSTRLNCTSNGGYTNPLVCYGAGYVTCQWENFGPDCTAPYCDCKCKNSACPAEYTAQTTSPTPIYTYCSNSANPGSRNCPEGYTSSLTCHSGSSTEMRAYGQNCTPANCDCQCATTPNPTPTPDFRTRCDLNLDNSVNNADLEFLKDRWYSASNTDINGDGTTNETDFSICLAYWQDTP